MRGGAGSQWNLDNGVTFAPRLVASIIQTGVDFDWNNLGHSQLNIRTGTPNYIHVLQVWYNQVN